MSTVEGLLLSAAFAIVLTVAFLLTAASGRVEERLREAYRRSDVPFDEAELAAKVRREEDAWADWVAIMKALDPTPHAEPTPIFHRAVRENIRRGGVA